MEREPPPTFGSLAIPHSMQVTIRAPEPHSERQQRMRKLREAARQVRADRIYHDPFDDGPVDWIDVPRIEDVEEWANPPRHHAQCRLKNGRFATRTQCLSEIAEINRKTVRKMKAKQRYLDASGRLRDGLGRFAKPRVLPKVRLLGGNNTISGGVIHPYNTEWTTITAPTGEFIYNPVYTTTTTGGTMPAVHPDVWNTWNTTTTGATTVYRPVVNQEVYQQWQVIAERDAEFFRRREEEEQRYAEERRIRAEQQQRMREERSRQELARAELVKGAQERALSLLRMILSPEERILWENTEVICVRGSEGGLYEIDTAPGRGVHGNIYLVDGHGCRLNSLCVAPGMYDQHPEIGVVGLPLADGWVGQYLFIKHNEKELLARGNWGAMRRCQQPGIPVLGEHHALAG